MAPALDLIGAEQVHQLHKTAEFSLSAMPNSAREDAAAWLPDLFSGEDLLGM